VEDKRYLVVTADDFGIGPATSEGILELAARGLVTGTVLLVNSPHAAGAVQHWRQTGAALELGWHPCLTLDRPILPAREVPTLVQPDGRFWGLGAFLSRLLLGRLGAAEIEAELTAQYRRFFELTGRPPALVNSHHHVQVFPPVGTILLKVLAVGPLPYVRRVREPWRMLAAVPGARFKRTVLSLFGRWDAAAQARAAAPGNDWLAGVTDPPWVRDPDYLVRWLKRIPGRVVELTCHPGYLDTTLIGRDCTAGDGHLLRRVRELQLLRDPSFCEACRQAGFRLVSPLQLARLRVARDAHAA
jgi:chitin disaccharide deacetylase